MIFPKRQHLIFALVLSLGGCSSSLDGRQSIEENELKEISFMGAHQDERCSKGCRYTDVPDTWYLRFCAVDGRAACFTKKITHAPWRWQHVGQRAKFTYRHWSGGASEWWEQVSIILSDTGEKVDL